MVKKKEDKATKAYENAVAKLDAGEITEKEFKKLTKK